MNVAKTINDMRRFRKNFQGTVGFVPTMGFLHEGHISLINLAKEKNDHVVVSIFVNPKQFGPTEDFQTYPRDIERDILLLEKSKIDIIFLPDVEELYPPGYETYVQVEKITKELEGKSRPEHFTGVTTIVTKLFNIIQPTCAYFGKKDAQQVAVIKKMVTDLNIPIDIMVGKTSRESNGLARSSRNVFLSEKKREEASSIYTSLSLAKKLFKNGERSSKKIKGTMENLIRTTSGKIDYISIADPHTLIEIDEIKTEALVSLAVRFGKTRLIDNLHLGK